MSDLRFGLIGTGRHGVRYANHLLRGDIPGATLAAIHRRDHAAGMKQALVTGAPSPMDYGELDKPKEVLKEDKEIERYPLKITAENVTIVPVDEMFAK